jgi:predicted Zn-dependent protease
MRSSPTLSTLTLASSAFLAVRAPQKAVQALSLAVKVAPKNPSVKITLADVLATTHEYRAAVKTLADAVTEHPDDLSVRRAHAGMMIRLGDWQGAQRALLDGLKRARTRSGVL